MQSNWKLSEFCLCCGARDYLEPAKYPAIRRYQTFEEEASKPNLEVPTVGKSVLYWRCNLPEPARHNFRGLFSPRKEESVKCQNLTGDMFSMFCD